MIFFSSLGLDMVKPAMLRPIADVQAQERVRETILEAFAAYEAQQAIQEAEA